jgi:hypothetical protein
MLGERGRRREPGARAADDADGLDAALQGRGDRHRRAYNAFVVAQRGTLEQANLRIKRHFAGAGGGQADYDRFTTMLANHYGQGETNPGACNEAAEIARPQAQTGRA